MCNACHASLGPHSTLNRNGEQVFVDITPIRIIKSSSWMSTFRSKSRICISGIIEHKSAHDTTSVETAQTSTVIGRSGIVFVDIVIIRIILYPRMFDEATLSNVLIEKSFKSRHAIPVASLIFQYPP